ncbi:hypothetical protein Tco_0157206 [Tanacetum coccineum]
MQNMTMVPRYHIRGVDVQTRFKTTFKKSNDPPLSRGYTLGVGEDSMKLLELMELCTKLSDLVSKKKREMFTLEDGEVKITATIDGQLKTITEASLRRHLKLKDADGISSLPNTEIFEQLALMGPKKTAWEQFSSNITTAIICLATNRTFNFSRMIFEDMVKNLDNRSKFLMYPRFIQILLNKHQRLLLPHKRTYVVHTLTQKLFSNMRRVSKGYTGVDIPLFSSMLVQGPIQQGEGSIVPVESHHTPITTPSTSQQPLSSPSKVPTPPYDSYLLGGHTPGSDEGRMQQTELMDLVIKNYFFIKSIKAVITESEPEQTTSKLKERQERAGYEAAIKLQEHGEAVRLQKQINEEER